MFERYKCPKTITCNLPRSDGEASCPGATANDVEKRDRTMAKVIIDAVGLEPEKYRLGYTKVHQKQTRMQIFSEGKTHF